MMTAIKWPAAHAPGTTDNFTSEEITVPGLTAATTWPYLIDTANWEAYYGYISQIYFHDGAGPLLTPGARFHFTTLTFSVEAEVREFEPPTEIHSGRLAWHGLVTESGGHILDLYHAWLLEDLPGQGVRILTQETQKGRLARDIVEGQAPPMLYAHQDWVKGLVTTALRAKLG